MTISYEIVGFHQSTGSAQVRFHNDDLPEGVVFSINLPVTEGRYPQGDALDSLIRSYAPVDIFERAAQLKSVPPPSMDGLPVRSAPRPSDLQSANAGEGQIFVREGKERIFLLQPLVRLYALDLPVEVI